MKEKKTVCLIAQFPPPLHGLSKAVDTLYKSEELNQMFNFVKVDISDNKIFLSNLRIIAKTNAELFYFTISQSKGGNLRDLVILKLLEIQGKKCIIHLHGGYYRQLLDNDLPSIQKYANLKLIKNLAGAIVLGKSLKEIFEGLLPDEKIFVVPNCVDDEYLISDKEFDEKLRLLAKQKIKHVLYLSNFIVSKGYRKVLEIAKLERENVEAGHEKKYHFDFAGAFFDKKEEVFFWKYVKENELSSYITYHGVVSGNDKKELLKNSNIFILLTRYPREGQPISILEAMGNGMVIVTTKHAGIPDIVNENWGIIFDKLVRDMPSEVFKKLDSINFEHSLILGRKEVQMKYMEKQYICNMAQIFRGEE